MAAAFGSTVETISLYEKNPAKTCFRKLGNSKERKRRRAWHGALSGPARKPGSLLRLLAALAPAAGVGIGLLHFLHVRGLRHLGADLELLVRTLDGRLQRTAAFLAPHEDHIRALGGVFRLDVRQ